MKTTFHPPAAATGDIGLLLQKIDARGQGFATTIDDDALLAEIIAFAESIKGRYDDIVLLGIGGSALGPQALRDALWSAEKGPHLHIIENVDPDDIRAVEAALDLSRTLFLPITKSGGTAETLSLTAYFKAKIEAKSLDLKEHMVVITDPENGFLRAQATAWGVRTFPVPPDVGGRFSVLTAVGLVPAALIGINIKELVAGARAERDAYRNENADFNTAYLLAAWQHAHYKNGATNAVMMPYVSRLETFCEWYAQLTAESTGKVNADSKSVGITPLRAVGVTDQHSQLQLYAQGPADKHYIFLTRADHGAPLPIPDMAADAKTTMLRGKTFGQLLDAEYAATRDTLLELKRPALEIEIETINEHSLGRLLFLFQGVTAFLGEMMHINAFDQPGVERSKVLTREYLEKGA